MIQAKSGPSFIGSVRRFLRPGVLLLALLAPASAAWSEPQERTTRVSVNSFGKPGNGTSYSSSISADGRYVAFASRATNLVPGDTNRTLDVFVHDRQTGETTRVSVSPSGAQGTDDSGSPSISADGRYVAFWSFAFPRLGLRIAGVFVHDRQTGETTRVSVSSSGAKGNNDSGSPSISADGRYVAFPSNATNLVSGDTNGFTDVFVHDRQTGETTRVNVDSSGTQANNYAHPPLISADGRYVTFSSYASNLVLGDTNVTDDIFVHDRQTGETTRVSVDSSGIQGDGYSGVPSISADGRYVAFESTATNLVPGDTNGKTDVFVHDRQTGETSRVSVDSSGGEAVRSSNTSSISADGRYVAFTSYARNLVPGDTKGYSDVFVHDRQTGITTRSSVSSFVLGVQGNSYSFSPSISADGRYVAFGSDAGNLVIGDSGSFFGYPYGGLSNYRDSGQLYVRDRQAATVYCPDKKNSLGCTQSASFAGEPSASAGRDFLLQADSLLNGQQASLLYSIDGPGPSFPPLRRLSGRSDPLSALIQLTCLAPAIRLISLAGTGGSPTPGTDCSGSLAFDFNAFIAGGTDPDLVVGQQIWCQFVTMDPGGPGGFAVSEAMEFTIQR